MKKMSLFQKSLLILELDTRFFLANVQLIRTMTSDMNAVHHSFSLLLRSFSLFQLKFCIAVALIYFMMECKGTFAIHSAVHFWKNSPQAASADLFRISITLQALKNAIFIGNE